MFSLKNLYLYNGVQLCPKLSACICNIQLLGFDINLQMSGPVEETLCEVESNSKVFELGSIDHKYAHVIHGVEKIRFWVEHKTRWNGPNVIRTGTTEWKVYTSQSGIWLMQLAISNGIQLIWSKQRNIQYYLFSLNGANAEF